ncbi:MAG TPA: hypothetical protein VFI28_10655 [Candidatus Limnocylindrales bacterium]|nr:hypothetical protein [Candidatus Limnocylindrales bacterium]
MTVDPAVPRKLGLREGMRTLLVNAPIDYVEGIVALVEQGTVEATDGEGTFEAESFDLVQVFCTDRAELERFGETAIVAVRRGGRLWVCYPKGGSGVATDLGRDVRWGPLADAGWRPVTQVAIDPVWSALRFRPEAEVGR